MIGFGGVGLTLGLGLVGLGVGVELLASIIGLAGVIIFSFIRVFW